MCVCVCVCGVCVWVSECGWVWVRVCVLSITHRIAVLTQRTPGVHRISSGSGVHYGISRSTCCPYKQTGSFRFLYTSPGKLKHKTILSVDV